MKMYGSIPYCREQTNRKTYKRSLKYKILEEEFITPLEVYLVCLAYLLTVYLFSIFTRRCFSSHNRKLYIDASYLFLN